MGRFSHTFLLCSSCAIIERLRLFPYEVEYLWPYSLFTAVRFWNEKRGCDDFNLPLHFSQKPWYTFYEVRAVQFRPFVYDAMNQQVPVTIEPMTPQEAALTDREPPWQTSWTSEYLDDPGLKKYAAKVGDELIALAAYEILENALVVHIVYMEAQPESNPTLDGENPKYKGIGRMLIAYGIKLSIDSGLTGDVVLEAKTTALAQHYEKDFGAIPLPTFQSSAPRYLIADEAAKRVFFTYLV